MRILHIFDGYGIPGERVLPDNGSVPTVIYNLAKESVNKGHSVTILERDNGELIEKEIIDGIHYVRLRVDPLPNPPYHLIKSLQGLVILLKDGWNVALQINKFLKEENFDAIHFHFPFAACFVVLLQKEMRKKFVYTAHADEYRLGLSKYLKPPMIVRFFSPDLFLMKKVRITVLLNAQLKNVLNARVVNDKKLRVISNGIIIEDYSVNKEEIEREKTKYGPYKILVLFSGTITPKKGVKYLIKAAEKLEDKDVLFLLVGTLELDREYSDTIIKYTKNHNINAQFLGYISTQRLNILYALCDIFVLPSLEEGFGMGLTAAMAAGKPLIGTNVGGISSQIINEWNGFLVDPMDENQLAEKITYLVRDEKERNRMGQNSRILAEREFDWNIITDKYIEVYQEGLK